jgi:hypothetical protein
MERLCSGLIWEILQFWQNLQYMLHPTVAIDSALVPGRKWKRGFFSIGSLLIEQGRE